MGLVRVRFGWFRGGIGFTYAWLTLMLAGLGIVYSWFTVGFGLVSAEFRLVQGSLGLV